MHLHPTLSGSDGKARRRQAGKAHCCSFRFDADCNNRILANRIAPNPNGKPGRFTQTVLQFRTFPRTSRFVNPDYRLFFAELP